MGDEIKESKISKKSYQKLADAIYSEFCRRKMDPKRVNLEKKWDEIDRQVDMIPEDRKRDPWEPVFELPLQANALETLATDVDDLRFSGTGRWFKPRSAMNDEFLQQFTQDVDFMMNGNPEESVFTASQSDVDAVTEGMLIHAHRKYRFNTVINIMDAEALKYGTCALRVRPMNRHTLNHQPGIITREEAILPVVTPISIRHFYPDDLPAKAAGQGMYLTPMSITESEQRFADLKMAAMKGGTKADNPMGGWITDNINRVNPSRQSDLISLIHVEGDLLLQAEDGEDLYVPNMCATVAYGKHTPGATLIRLYENPMPFHSVFHDAYIRTNFSEYGDSPLLKGESMQKAAQVAANSVILIAAREGNPPMWVNGNDPYTAMNGLNLSPGQLVESLKKPEPIIVGNMSATAALFDQFVKQHENSTGVNDQRQGAQTKSHQTAHAVNLETNKGEKRTVRYVRSTETFGVLNEVLQAEAWIIRNMTERMKFFVPEFKGHVSALGRNMPEQISFDIKGAATEVENAQQLQQRVQAGQLLFSVEPAARQLGGKPLNVDKVREDLVRTVAPNSEVAEYFDEAKAPAPQQGLPAGMPMEAEGLAQ